MSGIKEYREEKLKRERKNNDDADNKEYNRKLRRHRIKNYAIVIGILVLLIGIVTTAVVISYKNSYKQYVVEKSIRREDSEYAEYLCYEDGYVRCSRDGVAYFTFKGVQKWNKAYEVNNMSIARRGEYFAVSNVGATDIHIFNQDGYISTVNTNLPIVRTSISNQGLVVAILEDKEADYINMYDYKGNKVYTIKTTVESNGIPTDISVSPDGNKLAVAFTSVKGLELATSVVFYNFDEVGQNENERIVGGFDSYKNQLIGEVHFLNSRDVVAVAENVISFYMVKEYPKLIKNIELKDKISQVFYSKTNFGYVYTDSTTKKTTLCVYDTQGNKLFEQAVENKYKNFCFTESGIMMYGGNEFLLLNNKGKEVTAMEFEAEISDIIPAESNKDYLYITVDKVYKIKFK